MYDRVNWTNLGFVNIDDSNSFEGEIGVVRKSRGGSSIYKIYCIFMTKFFKVF